MRRLLVLGLIGLLPIAAWAQRGFGGRGGGFAGRGGFVGHGGVGVARGFGAGVAVRGGGYYGGVSGFIGPSRGFIGGYRPIVGYPRGYYGYPRFGYSRFGYPFYGTGFGFGFGLPLAVGYSSFGVPYYGASYYEPAYTYAAPAYVSSGPSAPPVVVNQYYTPETARPVVREYVAPPTDTSANSADPEMRTPLYLLAFPDGSVTMAVAYWVTGRTVHYVLRGGEQREVPVERLDREMTEQLNRERRVSIQLPR